MKIRVWDVFDHKEIKWRYFIIGQPLSEGDKLIYNSLCVEGCRFYWSTGLIDKMGKEIWEGEILKCYDHPTDIESGVFEVTLQEGAFYCGGMKLSDWGTAWVEIVGNTEQNPELL